MVKTYEILNDGAFVVTVVNGIRYFGFYHNVYNNGSEERIFEPIAPLNLFTPEEIYSLLEVAE